MDAVGVEKTILLTGAFGEEFDRLVELYSRHKDRFELWCGFDYTGFDQPGYGPAAVRGARALLQEGRAGGRRRGRQGPRACSSARRRDCTSTTRGSRRSSTAAASSGCPISIHVADPIWMYQPMDETNDGLMNAVKWRLDDKPGIVDHAGMVGGARARGRAPSAHHLRRLPPRQPRLRPRPARRALRPPAEPLRRLRGALRRVGRHPPHRGALLRALPATAWCTAPTWARAPTCTA